MTELLQVIRSRQDFLFQSLLNIFLAVVIFLNAEGGRLMGMPGGPLKISPVWPATGFSLAALLLFGFRVWPGIFLGNLCYNTAHFLLVSQEILSPVLAGISVSVGSLVQALVGAWAIRRFSSKSLFKSVRDILLFLVGGGIITCLIASSIGVVTLYVYGVLPRENMSTLWLTFWLGDCLGVYMITPFLIIWSLHRPMGKIGGRSNLETGLMVAAFLFMFWVIFIKTYPIGGLFILFGVWIAYRAGMHSLVLWNIIMCFAAVIPTTLGYGSVIYYFGASPWFALVIFLLVMIATTLIVSAIINEFERSLALLKTKNRDLEQDLEVYKKALKNRTFK